jgi:hypothetical protein
MMKSPQSESALADWENEGGSVRTAFRHRRKGDHAPCYPSLPPGYEAQPAWGFHDQTGRFSYEFNRVYGPPDWIDGRGPVCPLDEQLSYWGVIWSTLQEDGDEHPAGRWMTYGQARMLPGPRLTFERFSSLQGMRDELPGLLHTGNATSTPESPEEGRGAAGLVKHGFNYARGEVVVPT